MLGEEGSSPREGCMGRYEEPRQGKAGIKPAPGTLTGWSILEPMPKKIINPHSTLASKQLLCSLPLVGFFLNPG